MKMGLMLQVVNYSFFSILFLVSLVIGIKSQAETTNSFLWEREFRTDNRIIVLSMAQSLDGGYLLVGSVMKNDSQWYDGWLAKLDTNGNLQWEKQYGGFCDDWFSTVVPLPNGGYLLAGGKDPDDNPNHSDAWLVKLDKDGDLLWQHTISRGDDNSVNAVVPTDDGGTLLVGRTTTTVDGLSLGWIARLNAEVQVIWEQNLGSELRTVLPTPKGDFLVSGMRCIEADNQNRRCAGLLARLDDQGAVLWQHETSIDYSFGDVLSAQGNDGSVLFAGNEGNFTAEHSTRLVFLYPEGNDVRDTLSPEKFDGMARGLIAAREGGYAMAGWHSAKNSLADEGWFMVFDGQGNILREEQLEDSPDCLLQNREGAYLLSGSRINGNDIGWWIVKLNRRKEF